MTMSEHARLRAALRPFADAARCYPATIEDLIIAVPASRPSIGILVVDFRRAAAAYASGDEHAMVRALEHFAVVSHQLRYRLPDHVVTSTRGIHWQLPADGPRPVVTVQDIRTAAETLAVSSKEARSIRIPEDRMAGRQYRKATR